MRLSEISTITVGQILTRITVDKELEPDKQLQEIKVLTPKAISGGLISQEGLELILSNKKIDEDKITREGDVVIKLAGPYDSALVEKENSGLLIPSFCAIVRVIDNSRIPAKYVVAYLNTSKAIKDLTALSAGLRPMIKVSDLRELDIPILSIRDMEDLGEAYQLSAMKREKLWKLIKTEEELMNGVIIKAIKEAQNEN